MSFLDRVKQVFARSSPAPQLIPNAFYSMYQESVRHKQVLSKEPTFQRLRVFAKNSIVRRPILLVKDMVSRLDYRLENVQPGDQKPYKKQKATAKAIIEHPNIIHSRKVFFNMILEDLLVLDAGSFEKAFSAGSSRPLFLYPVDGASLQFVVPYDYTDDDAARFAQQQPKGMRYFSAKEIAFLQRNHFTDRPQGLSPVLSAFSYVQFLLGAQDRADAVASNATADFILSLGSQINPEQREKFVEYFSNEIEGTGKIPIVSGTDHLEAKQIRAINKDGLYQEWQQFLMTIIAVAFGLPPQKIGVLMSNDRSTADDTDQIVMTEMIKPYADVIEDAMNEHVLRPLGFDKLFRFRFVYEESQKEKTAKESRINAQFQSGYITANEAREKAGFERMDNEFCELISDERKAKINAEFGIGGGFNGLGDVKDNYE